MFDGIFLDLLLMLMAVLIDIAALVIGILITTSKIKSTKILGIGYIISAALGFISDSLFILRSTLKSPELVASMSPINTVLSFMATVAGLLCICLFIHRNYGYKWIYFPLLAQPVVSIISTLAFRFVLIRIAGSTQYIAGTGLSNAFTSLILGSVEALILILVFYKNRKAEKIIPHAWIIRIVSFCCSLILNVSSVIFYGKYFFSGAGGDNLYFALISKFTMFQYCFLIFLSLVGLVMPVYILVMAKKAEKQPEETAAYIED